MELSYGKKNLKIDLDDHLDCTVVYPRFVEGLEDEKAAVFEALRNPIGSEPLRKLVKSSDTVGIIFSDITRATPYNVLLPPLLEELSAAKQIILFNATGTHRENSRDELAAILGESVVDKYTIIQNDATDSPSHELVGRTTTGNDVYIHRDFLACDVKIPTGFIEPHFFAGFSGGGKAIMPGMALLSTVMQNHSVKNLDSLKATWGVTSGNPLWEEVREAAAMTDPTFLLNITLNRKKRITGVFAGDFEQAHREGCAFVKQTAMAQVNQLFDIVLTTNSGFPLDLNLYQSVKGMSAAYQIVKKGGSIIVAADCWDGIPDHGEYGRLLQENESLDQLLDLLRSPGFSCQDMWQAQIHGQICQNTEVHFYSHNLSDSQLRNAFLHPCRDIRATLLSLVKRYGKNAKICILPEGPQTIPYLAEQ